VTFSTPTAEDLGLYLNLDEIRGDRADLLIAQAVSLAQAIVSPLPDGATAVVLSAAARAYDNPTNANYETIGPMSVQRQQAGGLYLTKAEKVALKAMAGRGGAFTVDPTPADVNPWVTWPVVTEDGTGGVGPGMDYEPGFGWV
jgi:hypothetical protein